MKKIVAIVLTILITMSFTACNLGSGEKQGKRNMVAIGTTSTGSFENKEGQKYSFSLCVDKVYRGEEAFNFINDKMMANKRFYKANKPKEVNQEYLVAKITYKLISYDGGETKKVDLLKPYNEDFKPYPILIAPVFYDRTKGYGELKEVEAKVGETVEGYEIFQVKKDDKAPCMSCASVLADYTDGLWFQLYEE